MADTQQQRELEEVAEELAPDEEPDAVDDLDGILCRVSHFLTWISKRPVEDADEILELVEEIRDSQETAASPSRSKDATQMFTEERMQATRVNLTVPRSTELDGLLTAVVDNPDTWLSTPSMQLGGRRPGELVGTDEEFKIFDILHAVDQGLS
jgi:hypothetical protein